MHQLFKHDPYFRQEVRRAAQDEKDRVLRLLDAEIRTLTSRIHTLGQTELEGISEDEAIVHQRKIIEAKAKKRALNEMREKVHHDHQR